MNYPGVGATCCCTPSKWFLRTDLFKVDDTISSLLMGHALDGVSKKVYFQDHHHQPGRALRSEQARISRRIVQLLELTSTTFIGDARKAAVAGSAARAQADQTSRAAQAREPFGNTSRRGTRRTKLGSLGSAALSGPL